MKKLYLLFAFLTAALSMSAATRVLYSQNFESAAAVPADWKSLSLQNCITIASDPSGKYINFAPGAANDRSFYNFWGADITTGKTAYKVAFDFNPAAWGTNHVTTELAVFSGEEKMFQNNGNIAVADNQVLFDIKEATGNTAAAAGIKAFKGYDDDAQTLSLNNTWYTVTLDVNVEARTVDYDIWDMSAQESVYKGTYTVPEGVSMQATGIFFLGTRYQSFTNFDNIVVSEEVDQDVANKPTVALTGINLKQRVYSITTTTTDEEIHATFNGADITGDIIDGVWSNNPNYDPDSEELATGDFPGGTLVVWTTMGDAKSEDVTMDVDASIIPSPAATATIVNVSEGYGKTFKLYADGNSLPIPATVAFTVNGQTVSNNGTYDVTAQGAITVVSQAFGYGATTTTIENNVEYETKLFVDWQNMTNDEVLALPNMTAANWADTNLSHWLGHFMAENYEGAVNKPKNQYTADGPMLAASVAVREDQSGYEDIAPLKFNSYNSKADNLKMCILFDEGVVYATTTGGNNYTVAIDPQYVSNDAAKPNFAVLTITNSYDRADKQATCHSTTVITTDQTYSLYRFDTAINSVKIMTFKGFASGIQGVSDNSSATSKQPLVKRIGKNGQILIGDYNIMGQRVK